MRHLRRIALALVSGCILATCAAPFEKNAAPAKPVVTTETVEPARVEPFAGVVVDRAAQQVELRAWVVLDEGFLEQVACAPGTREHESLVVPEASPSQIHAALLMAGFEPGAPGAWSYDNGTISSTPPTGAALDVLVRHERDGAAVIEPVRAWIRDHRRLHAFPVAPWRFAGSSFVIVAAAPGTEPREWYAADLSGSIVGLVTFGDEVVGFSHVLADEAEVAAPEWEAATGHLPPVGTEVTLILRPWRDEPAAPAE